jgi:hypothetical protein
MVIDLDKHTEVMKKIEIQIRKDQAKELARKLRFAQIQKKLKEECQEQTNDDR